MQELLSDNLSDEYTRKPSKHKSKTEESRLLPQQVAVKIWDEWMQCRLLSIKLNSHHEFKINRPD